MFLKTNNENSIAKIIALAKELNVVIERNVKSTAVKNEKEELKKRIPNFKAKETSSFRNTSELDVQIVVL